MIIREERHLEGRMKSTRQVWTAVFGLMTRFALASFTYFLIKKAERDIEAYVEKFEAYITNLAEKVVEAYIRSRAEKDTRNGAEKAKDGVKNESGSATSSEEGKGGLNDETGGGTGVEKPKPKINDDTDGSTCGMEEAED